MDFGLSAREVTFSQKKSKSRRQYSLAGLGCRVLGFRVRGLGFRVEGSGFRV